MLFCLPFCYFAFIARGNPGVLRDETYQGLKCFGQFRSPSVCVHIIKPGVSNYCNAVRLLLARRDGLADMKGLFVLDHCPWIMRGLRDHARTHTRAHRYGLVNIYRWIDRWMDRKIDRKIDT